jgi:hypothetical protein
MFTNLTNSVYLDEFIKAYMGSYFRKPIMPNSGSRKDYITLQQHEPILNSYEFCVISAKCYRTPDRKEPVWYSFTWRNSCNYHAGQKYKINFKYRLSNISPNCNSEVTGGITDLLISCLLSNSAQKYRKIHYWITGQSSIYFSHDSPLHDYSSWA